MTSKADERFNRNLRARIAALPLRMRQEAAEALQFIDGRPLDEADIEMNVRQFKAAGMSLSRAIHFLSVADPGQRRIGSLNPDEVAVIAGRVWEEAG